MWSVRKDSSPVWQSDTGRALQFGSFCMYSIAQKVPIQIPIYEPILAGKPGGHRNIAQTCRKRFARISWRAGRESIHRTAELAEINQILQTENSERQAAQEALRHAKKCSVTFYPLRPWELPTLKMANSGGPTRLCLKYLAMEETKIHR